MSITAVEATLYIEQMQALKRFPRDPKPLRAITQYVAEIMEDTDHADRTVRLLLEECDDWPGTASLKLYSLRSKNPARSLLDFRDPFEQDANGNYRNLDMYQERMAVWRREFEENVKPNLCPDCSGYGMRKDPNDAQKVIRCHCPEGLEKWVNKRTGALCQPDDKEAVRYIDPEMVAWRTRIGLEGMISALARMKRMPGGRSDAVEPPPPVSEDRCGECGNLRGYGIVQIGPGFPKRPCVCATREFIEFMAKQPGYEHWNRPVNTFAGYEKPEES